jgi:hypothetical protein
MAGRYDVDVPRSFWLDGAVGGLATRSVVVVATSAESAAGATAEAASGVVVDVGGRAVGSGVLDCCSVGAWSWFASVLVPLV